MDDTCFAGGVRVGFPRIDRDAVDRGDVDDLGHVLLGGLAQHGRQGLGEEEGGFHVQVHHFVPAVFREFIEGCCPSSTCVVDQNIQVFFFFTQVLDQFLNTFFVRDIQGHGDTCAKSGKFLRCGVASCCFTRRDVDLRTLAQQAFGDHATNAAGAASNECDAASQGKEFIGVHGVS